MTPPGAAKKPRRTRDRLSECQVCGCRLCDSNWTPSMQKYRRYICSPCWTARQVRYGSKDPNWRTKRKESAKKRREGWSDERKEQERKRRYENSLRRKHGVSLPQFEHLLQLQGGGCGICKGTEPKGRGGWHLDHDHFTGGVRGLLCSPCNLMLGLAKDDVGILGAAVAYLRKWSA